MRSGPEFGARAGAVSPPVPAGSLSHPSLTAHTPGGTMLENDNAIDNVEIEPLSDEDLEDVSGGATSSTSGGDSCCSCSNCSNRAIAPEPTPTDPVIRG